MSLLRTRSYASPVAGPLILRVSELGVRSIEFGEESSIPRSAASNPILDKLTEELERYFSGEPVKFTVPLDLAGAGPFRLRVWRVLQEIPYGEVRSYGWVAAAAGVPKAARAVGGANGSNPIPIVIPCHRVVRSDGSLGGYSSGIEIKRKLLELEGIYF
ncbi:MAG: methylated-DNA--[protein]-cysteine S-methyltransferase [Pseudomonadota bacterium]